MIGTQRSAVVSTLRKPHYDLEIPEYPIRDQQRALELITAIYSEAKEKHFDDVLRYLETDVYSSSDGDDRGFTISDTLEDGETPIDPDVQVILLDLIRRRNGDHYVIGGNRLQPAVRESAAYGDSFWQLAIERDGSEYAVTDTLKMPCWEMFRCESDTGYLERFEQRRRLLEIDPDFAFPPVKMIHFRYRRRGLYGQSIFGGCMTYRADYNRARSNLAKVTNDTGSTPYSFDFPEGTTREQKLQFKDVFEQSLSDGVTTGIYLDPGMGVTRLGADVPNFEPLINNKKSLEYGLVPAGFPIWLIPGMDTTGARDISGAPERAYIRLINDFRAVISEGIRKAGDIELYLKLGPDGYQEKVVEKGYSIVWPKLAVLTNQGTQADIPETDADGITELEAESIRRNHRSSLPTEWLHKSFSSNGHG